MSRFSSGRHLLAALLLLCVCSDSVAEQGDDSAFFQQRSQLAYNAVFGLPVVAPRLVQTREWQFSLEHANQFSGGQADDERLVLDGETSRFAIRHRQRLGACWQLEATVPFVSHQGGEFDSSIDAWHKFFGLPDADRDSTDFDRLVYSYTDASGTRHDVREPQSGIGDIQLAVQRALGCQATANAGGAAHMIRAGIKLPTGNPAELRGSGEFDLFADWQSPVWKNRKRWRAGAALGVLVLSQTDRFAEQENLAVYGSLGVQLVVHQKLRFIAQLDGHTPFYRSALRELGDLSLNLALGARYLAGRGYTFEVSISEDAAIDTTPDIVARLAVKYRPEPHR